MKKKKKLHTHTYIYIHNYIHKCIYIYTQMVKNLSTMQETWVQSLGGEDPLKEGMTTHSGILAWRIPWTEKRATVHGVSESDTTE